MINAPEVIASASKIARRNRLYGRDTEVAQLLEALERVNRGRGEVLLLPGLSGTGKTSLANTLREPTKARNGFFLEGKFNQYDQNVAYVAWRQALADFCEIVGREEEDVQRKWAEVILEAVAGQGQLLVDLVPEFEHLLGKQAPVDKISPQESRHRFAGVIRDTLAVICRPEHPVVLFIDDWQWADPASLHLLTQLQLDSTLRYLLLVASYRSDEVEPGDAFQLSLDELRSQQIPLSDTRVDNLSAEELERLVGDSQRVSADAVNKVATQLHLATGGNAFFARALLESMESRESAQVGPKSQSLFDLPTDVVDVFTRRIDALPTKTQRLLSLASCLGHRFDIRTLSIISRCSVAECTSALSPAMDLVVAIGDNATLAHSMSCRFVHDRVQQAAYSRIKVNELPWLRLQIARQMLAEMDEVDLDERICELADHFNAGATLLESNSEILRGIELNVAAARRARDATAFYSALEFHRAAQKLLQADDVLQQCWEEHHQLVFALYLEHAETEFLEGDPAEAEKLIRHAVTKALTPVQKAEALNTLVVQHTLQARYADAISTGREALAAIGMQLPMEDFEQARDAAIQECQRLMEGRSLADVIDMPVASDEVMQTTAKVLITMGPPTYRAHQQLWSVIVPRVVNLTLQHGHIPQIGYSHTALAGLLGWVSSDFKTGEDYCEIAREVMTPSLASSSDKSVFHLMMGSSARHWYRHLSESTGDYLNAIETGRQSGNLQYAAYAVGHNMYCRFFQGTRLEELIGETECSLTFSRTRRNQWATDLLDGGLHIFQRLLRPDEAVDVEDSWESEYLTDVEAHHNQQVACIYHVLRSQQCLLQGDPEGAFEYSQKATPLIATVGTQGLLPWPEYVFVRAMSIGVMQCKEPSSVSEELRHEMQSLTEQLGIWATQCPENFKHKHLLVSASWARLEERTHEAMNLLDEAIISAHENGFTQWEGFANERASELWASLNQGRLQQVYWQRAYDCFESWGATSKTDQMDTEYRESIAAAVREHTESSETLVNGFADRHIKLLQDETSQFVEARKQLQMVRAAEELANAADSLRVDVALGRQKVSRLREQRNADQALNQELERRVKERTIALERTSAELQLSERRFRTTVEAAPVGIVMINEQGTIVIANSSLCRLFGYQKEELLGQKIELLVPKELREDHVGQRNEFFKNPTQRPMGAGRDLYGVHKDGTLVPVELGLTPAVLDEGMGAIGTVVDLTARKEAELELHRLVAEVRKSNEELEQFAYIASHDLQEPLRKIASYCKLLQEEQSQNLDEEGQEYLEVAINGATRLQRLVRDLLTFSRITTRGRPLSATCASSSLDDATTNLSVLIEEKSAVITKDALPEVWADAGQLTHLFQNLIGNAIKYCDQAVPEIHVGVRDLGDTIEFYVQDNGIGIEPQFHEQIFQVFQRLHNRREYSGTGIGLALCKRIVERFGGQIRVDSTPGAGSTFYFTTTKVQPETRQDASRRHSVTVGAPHCNSVS
ncbi:AAA family ATPase [Aeoliella sp.]|uniref:AAA family ATPase n=1 Tax=Aeoliella sp. TaxID=2795800 RepID=UPI003CCBFC6C